MAEGRLALEVSERAERGSAAARRMRREGLVPGVIYGGGADPVAITIAERELRRALTGDHGLNAILDVDVAGSSRPAILKEFQRDPICGPRHPRRPRRRPARPADPDDGQHRAGRRRRLAGRPRGRRAAASRARDHVEALPLEVPERIEVDVSALDIGDAIRLEDMPEVAGVRFSTTRTKPSSPTSPCPPASRSPKRSSRKARRARRAPSWRRAPRALPRLRPRRDGEAAGEPGADES